MTQHPTDDLGLYALGLVDPKERASIERHLASCEQCRRDLHAHEATVAALAEGAGMLPRAELRDLVIGPYRRRRSFVGFPAFAYVMALILAMALGATFVSLNQERALRDEYAQALAAVVQGARVVPLAATGTSGRGALIVPPSGPSYLVLDLPAPPPGQVYEAWLIRDGQPRAMGLAPVHAGVVTLPMHDAVQPGDVAAVTVERAGGVDAPSSQPILAGGV